MSSFPIDMKKLDFIKDVIDKMIRKEKRHYGGICLQLEDITKIVVHNLSDIEKNIVYDTIVVWLRSKYANVSYYKETNFLNMHGAYVGYLVSFNF
jgi:hypothetical protein